MSPRTRQSSSKITKITKNSKTPELHNETAKDSFMKNAELKAMTFCYLRLKNDVNMKSQFLLNAALASKDFLEVALDALWEELESLVPLLKLLPALQLDPKGYVLTGNVPQADWDRLQYYARKVKFFKTLGTTGKDDPQVHPSTYFRIAQLQSSESSLFPSLRHLHYNLSNTSITDSHSIFFFLSPLLDSLEFVNIKGFENTIVGPFLATLSSHWQILTRLVLRSGRLSVNILKNSIAHFKQLRSLELFDAVSMKHFGSWVKVLGTFPSLASLTLLTASDDPTSHLANTPEGSKSRSEGPKYFNALEDICVTGSFILIQHLLGFIDSPILSSISVYPIFFRNRSDPEDEDDPFTPSMTIIASKWSESLIDLTIGRSRVSSRFPISKCLMLLKDFHEMEMFHLIGWKMEGTDDDVIRLLKSWPKLMSLKLHQSLIFLSTLRTIAENCPDLDSLEIQLDVSDPDNIPPFDTSIVRLDHELETLTLAGILFSSESQPTLELKIQVTRHLDLIFPNLTTFTVKDDNWSEVRQLVWLCQDVREL